MDKNQSERVIVRSGQAGVFYGQLVSRDGSEVVLAHSRRLWFWSGANTLTDLANVGTSDPSGCKFPAPLTGEHIVLGVCEILPVTDVAAESLDDVPVWTI